MLLRTNFNMQIERSENGLLGAQAYERNAVKTCCQKYFKLIFMDIQMPVMDGHDSTELILKTYNKLVQQA